MEGQEHTPDFLDEIMDLVLEKASEHEVFDPDTLQRLKELSESPNLAKFDSVVTALKGGPTE